MTTKKVGGLNLYIDLLEDETSSRLVRCRLINARTGDTMGTHQLLLEASHPRECIDAAVSTALDSVEDWGAMFR